MKKITLFLLFLVSSLSYGQLYSVPVCLDLTSNAYGPMNSVSNANATNRTAVIYPASQLEGIAGQELTAAYFDRGSAGATMSGTPSFKIYLKEVTESDWGSESLDWATATQDAVLVYDSNPIAAVGNSAGWKEFAFSTNFEYSGTKNLAVLMEYTNSQASSTVSWSYEFDGPCISSSNSNTSKYSNNTTGVLPTSLGTSNYRRPVIGFDFTVSCNAPTNFEFADLTATSVSLSWTAGGEETSWEYAVVPTAAGVPTAGTVIATNTVDIVLDPTTAYTAYVRALCGEGDESVWKTISFTSPCSAITSLPWTEDFEGLTSVGNDTFPPCWDEENGDWSTSLVSTYNTPRSGTKYLRIFYNATNEYMWTPGFALEAGKSYDLSTFVQGDNHTGWVIDMFYNTNQTSVGATQMGASYNLPGAGTTAIMPYVEMRRSFTPTADGVYYFAMRANVLNSAAWYVAFDDFRLEETPLCPSINDVQVAGITANSAIVSWSAVDNAESYNIQYGPTGFALGEGTIVTDVTSPFTLEELDSVTGYSVYVQADCTEENSVWAGPYSFTTACAPMAIPTISEGFEVTTALPSCWDRANVTGTNQWSIFTPTGTGDVPTAHSGTKVIIKSYSSSDALLFSPAIDYSEIEDATRINMYLFRHASAHANDKYVFYVNTTPSLTGATEIGQIFLKTTLAPTVTGTGWYNYTIDIPEAMQGEETVYVIARGVTANGFSSYSLAIDEFKVEFTPELSAPSFNVSEFKAYPNPVSDILSVSYSSEISTLEVFNLLGQPVLNASLNSNQGSINVSSLAAGAYIIKIHSAGQIGTYKFVKR